MSCLGRRIVIVCRQCKVSRAFKWTRLFSTLGINIEQYRSSISWISFLLRFPIQIIPSNWCCFTSFCTSASFLPRNSTNQAAWIPAKKDPTTKSQRCALWSRRLPKFWASQAHRALSSSLVVLRVLVGTWNGVVQDINYMFMQYKLLLQFLDSPVHTIATNLTI